MNRLLRFLFAVLCLLSLGRCGERVWWTGEDLAAQLLVISPNAKLVTPQLLLENFSLNLTSFFTACVRALVGNRRHALRYKVRHKVRLLLGGLPSETGGIAERSISIPLEGHTLDLSEIGMSLLVPVVSTIERSFSHADDDLPLTLELPNGLIHLVTTRARVERLAGEAKYLLGVRIKEISEGDRSRFTEYLRTLS